MANQVKIDLSVQDTSGSIKKRTSETQALNKELSRSQQLATGTRTGSGAVRASYSAAGENTAYGQARGSMGATGASGRDFANQAQGLGGLVRLYATYAANLFAVSAAFTALSQAMNTANMVQGLDQLGAAAGKSLGTLAQKFTETTGGAVSLREAMEAVVKASSSGLSDQQILQIAEIAKKASQALGVSMTDAVSRLTRGITKLEPELLDELAIFTKLGTATENYARKIGKSEASLSQFERQQAFANAVLAEGLQKFNSIEIPTNPYDKLLASLKNIGFETLNIVNKALVPLVELLSQNPTILAAGLALFASSIVKKVIPALGEYREALKDSAETAKSFYEKQAAAAKNAADISLKAKQSQKNIKLEALENEWYNAMESAEKRVSALKNGELSGRVSKIMAKDTLDVTQREIKYLDLLGKRDPLYKDLARSIEGAQKVNQKLLDNEIRTNAELAKRPSLFTTAGIAAARMEMARGSAVSKSIVSQAGIDASEKGFGPAVAGAIGSLKTEKLGVVRTAFTGISVAANLAAVGIGNAFTVLNRMMGVIGLLYGVYELLNYTLSTNSKQMGVFNSAVENTTDSVKLATNVTKIYGETVSISSLLAKANAFETIATNVDKLTSSLESVLDNTSNFDRFIDGFLTVIDKDLKTNFANSLSSAISAGLDQISDPELKKQAEDSIKDLLKVGTTSSSTVKAAIKNLPTEQEVLKVGKATAKVFTEASDKAKAAAAPLNAVKDGFKSIDKSFADLSNTLINKDPLTLFALDLAKQTDNLTKAFTTVQNKAALLNEILKDTSTIKAFPAESQAGLLAAAAAQKELIELTTQRQELQRKEQVYSLTANAAKGTAFGDSQQALANAYKMAGTALGDEIVAKTKYIENTFTNALAKGSEISVKLIESGLTRAYAQAAIDTQKTLVGNLPKTAATIQIQTQLEVESIGLRKQELSSTRDLINAIDKDRISRELAAVNKEIADTARPGEPARPELLQKRTSLEQQQLAYTSPRALKGAGTSITPEALNILSRQTGYLSQMAGLTAQQQSAIINGVVATVGAGFEATRKLQERELADIKQQNQTYFDSDAFRAMGTAAQESERFRRTQAEQARQDELARLGPQQALATAGVVQAEAMKLKGGGAVTRAAGGAATLAQQELDSMIALQGEASKLAKTTSDRNITTGQVLRTLDKETLSLQQQSQVYQINQDINSNLLAIEKDRLQTQFDLGLISQDSYRQQSVALDQITRKNELDNKLSSLKSQLLIDQISLTKEYNQAVLEGKETESITSRIIARSNEYNLQVSGAQRVYTENERNKALTENLSAKQIAYSDIFKNSFDGMADAILNWAQTGKWAGKELFNSLIADLARYELRLQTAELYKSFRPSLLGGVAAMFGGGMPGIDSTIATFIASGASLESAKGTAWDYGIQAFAKGGAFTNQIVDSPTLFKFAKGTGMMGEAGPEAIMPLTRDGQGNLGVRGGSGGGNTEVVVNNYSTAQAETTETVDSRGNRKIEVTIGDMTAGEISRSGSASQKAVGNTFGLKPQLIRR